MTMTLTMTMTMTMTMTNVILYTTAKIKYEINIVYLARRRTKLALRDYFPIRLEGYLEFACLRLFKDIQSQV